MKSSLPQGHTYTNLATVQAHRQFEWPPPPFPPPPPPHHLLSSHRGLNSRLLSNKTRIKTHQVAWASLLLLFRTLQACVSQHLHQGRMPLHIVHDSRTRRPSLDGGEVDWKVQKSQFAVTCNIRVHHAQGSTMSRLGDAPSSSHWILSSAS